MKYRPVWHCRFLIYFYLDDKGTIIHVFFQVLKFYKSTSEYPGVIKEEISATIISNEARVRQSA